MTHLLDTCTLSDFARREPRVVARFAAKAPDALAVSTLTVMEVEYGLRIDARAAAKVGTVMRDLLQAVRRLPLDEPTALRAAEIRAVLKKAGRPVGAYDLLIAATALHHGLILVTGNTRELGQIKGLVLEDWRR